MKIYAIRDRMIDYYLQPFVAHEDKAVQASIAQLINQPRGTDAICQAPHHFELWRLGEITPEGHITAAKEFLADCGALIRPVQSSRTNTPGNPETGRQSAERDSGATAQAEGQSERPTGGAQGPTGA